MLDSLKPPKGASVLLSLFSNEPDFPEVEGDLSEEFHQLALQSGPSAARQWYWRQAVRNSLAFVTRRESINALGSALLSLAIFRLVVPIFFQWLRFVLGWFPCTPAARLFLMTLFEIALSFLLGATMARFVKGGEPLLRLTFTASYFVSVLFFIIRSEMYVWWSSVQSGLNFLGLLCVITSFWIGSFYSERRQRPLSLS